MPTGVFGLPTIWKAYAQVIRAVQALVTYWDGQSSSVLSSGSNYVMPAAHTIEVWVKWTTVAANTGIVANWSTNGTMLWVNVSGGGIIAFHFNGSDLSSGITPVAGLWYHIVGTYDGTNRAIYVNGSLMAGPTAQAAPSAVSTPLITGNYAGSGSANLAGVISRVAVYSRALSVNEVQQHYVLGSSRLT